MRWLGSLTYEHPTRSVLSEMHWQKLIKAAGCPFPAAYIENQVKLPTWILLNVRVHLNFVQRNRPQVVVVATPQIVISSLTSYLTETVVFHNRVSCCTSVELEVLVVLPSAPTEDTEVAPVGVAVHYACEEGHPHVVWVVWNVVQVFVNTDKRTTPFLDWMKSMYMKGERR